jgi:2-keto-3-deoxy-galactonokinase
MTTDERINNLEKRVDKIEDKQNQQEISQITNKFELATMITEAVAKGNEKALEMIEEQNKRITTLEQSEANKALEEKKDKRKFIRDVVVAGIVSTVLGWIVLSFLNNYASITSDKIRSNVENEVSINEKTNQNII